MTTAIRFSSALRPHVRTKIEQLGTADIVIGIPSYDSGDTISHVVQVIIQGLDHYYKDRKALIMISDGGSTDDTRELARAIDPKSYNIESVVTVYRGSHGKGSGLRAVFEVAAFLRARAIAVFDSDLLSITPEWVRNILDPVIEGYDYVAPDYKRYKLDGTITNTIAYNLTRALYGKTIRQPIGGDFGLSPALIKFYLDQDVWETDVAKFGVDIWMTTSAIVGGFRICQAKLGAKVHGQKDPSADLGQFADGGKILFIDDVLPHRPEIVQPHLEVFEKDFLVDLKSRRLLTNKLAEGRNFPGPADFQPEILVALHQLKRGSHHLAEHHR